jgi:Flp pilus assembly pilin Flp
MKLMWTRRLRRLVAHDSGQDLMEYGLLMFLIAIVAMAGVRTLGTTINSVFWEYIAVNF